MHAAMGRERAARSGYIAMYVYSQVCVASPEVRERTLLLHENPLYSLYHKMKVFT